MEVVAMLLAGGQGTRLGVITDYLAKPAVPFGGKYRIIDFTLSNSVNSGIEKIGVLTQYKPHVLSKHIGIGKPWDLDIKGGGVTILPPYAGKEGGTWYLGTADAVFRNIEFVDSYNPDFVLVLSGDHVYKMDYNDMIDFHIEKQAVLTVACMEVPISEASRFGIMVTDPFSKIVEFQEKPKEPKSNLASLGIYVFNWDYLKKVLIEDAQDPNSEHDFGKNIIPKAVEKGDAVFAYQFDGYWKDVGTIHSYWESNIELVGPLPPLNIHDINWKIFTLSKELPPAYVSPMAELNESLVGEGSEIYGKITKSVLFQGVFVDEGAEIIESVIMDNVYIGKNVKIYKSIICENTVINEGVQIGFGEYKDSLLDSKIYNTEISVIGFNVRIPKNVTIGKNTVVGNNLTEDEIPNEIPSGGYII